MISILTITFFILGTIIGSFLNVIILRYNTGMSLLSLTSDNRSICLTCGKTLHWYELIPVLSYMFLKGACSKCGSKISMQYPLVELATGLLFVLVFLKLQDLLPYPLLFIGLMFWFFVMMALYVVIFVYDIHHKIIPNVFSYTLAIMTFLYTLLAVGSNFTMSVATFLNLFAGFILFLPFWFLWFISKGRWIGLGDGKLALSIGWILGFVNGLSAIIIGFYIGAIVGIGILFFDRVKYKKKVNMKREVPFGPFLIIGMLWMLFFPFDVINISAFLGL